MVLAVIAPHADTISIALGWASITCWLGAQFPQILANIQNQSVEGLALPFLANWLFGDITNLVGCILTDQLPFQKYLSSYFCFVDICLVYQYCYYSPSVHQFFRGRQLRVALDADDDLTSTTEVGSPRVLIYSPQVHFRELSSAAAQVARAAADVAAEYEQGPSSSRRRAASMSAAERSATASQTSYRKSASVARDINLDSPQLDMNFEDEDGDEVPAMMYESFRSEDGRGRGTSVARKALVPSSTLADLPQRQHEIPSSSGIRGRLPTRQPPQLLHDTDLEQPPLGSDEADLSTAMATHIRDSTAAASSWSRSRERGVSRKRATIIFMGIWTLFGVSGVVKGGQAGNIEWSSQGRRGSEYVGKVWDERGSAVGSVRHGPSFFTGGFTRMRGVQPDGALFVDDAGGDKQRSPPPPPPREKPSTKQVIGRVSSWMCTVLYLTSRLPQIWKNYVRKSVEGLSMILFISAFLGNTFYVLSILTNPVLNQPAPIPMDYLREAVPFLLGSGGTLLFDITIISQSIIYRGRRPKPVRSSSMISGYGSPIRRRSVLRSVTAENERLLGASGVSESGAQRQASRRYGSVSGAA
ncbi:hypothetical protein FRB93_002441 [Tulasnella sp. JGI-2019a]|nr:hypothetical protein FRB93_002441 [Tulasnella sp. JGI-2019a]